MTSVRDGTRDDQVVSLEVPARPGYVVLARLALSAVCRLTPLPDEDVADLKLAVTEAANALVDDGSEEEVEDSERSGGPTNPSGPLRPVGDPASEGTLRFEFELGERELRIDITSDAEPAGPEDERELSHAITAATVDDFQTGPGSIRLLKRLVGRSE
jgi:hypothetical protein